MTKSFLIRGLDDDMAFALTKLAEFDGMKREPWLKKKLQELVDTSRLVHAGERLLSVLDMRRQLGDIPSPIPPHCL